MASTGESSGGKKLSELRVIDLKAELEKRGLEKTGVKAALMDRLKKALAEAGHSAEEFLFEVQSGTPNKKSKDGGSEKTEDKVELQGANVTNDSASDSTITEPAVVEAAKPIDSEVEAEVLNDTAYEDAVDMSAEDEDKLLGDEDVDTPKEEEPGKISDDATTSAGECETSATAEDKLESTAAQPGTGAGKEESPLVEQEPMETQTSDMATSTKLQETSGQATSSRPPTPTSVPCPVPLTAEDTVKLHNSFERKEDDLSLIVHVDDSQNDIDNDLLSDTSERKTEAKMDEENVMGVEEAGKSREDTENVAAAATESATDEEATKDSIDKPTDSEKTDTTKAQAQKMDPKEGSKDGEKAKSSEDAKAGATKSTATKGVQKLGAGANSRNLWISGLSSTTRATDLKQLFSKHGKVAGAKVVTNARSPGSRCYGFVTMSTAEEASKCIQHLHRTELHGRMISVEKAKNDPAASAKKVEPPRVGSTTDATATKKDEKKDEKKEKTSPKKDHDKDGEKKEDKKDDKKDDRDRRRSHDRRHERSTSRKRDEKKDGKDLLSFDKIKEERERERLHQQERRMREEHRRRRMEMEREHYRQQHIRSRQQEEAGRLQQERDRLRLEREKLEREKIEAERERIALEREKRQREREQLQLEREREEHRRRQLEQQREEHRRAAKRPHGNRDDFWDSKRPASDGHFDGGSGNARNGERSNRSFDSKDSRGGDTYERRVERYDRRDGRSLDGAGGNMSRRDGGSMSRYEDKRGEDRRDGRDSGVRGRDAGRDRDDRRPSDRYESHRYDSDRDRSHERGHDTRRISPVHRNVPRDGTGPRRSDSRDTRGVPSGGDRGSYGGGSSTQTTGGGSWHGGSHGGSGAGGQGGAMTDKRGGYNPGPGLLGNAPVGINSHSWSSGSGNTHSTPPSHGTDRWSGNVGTDRGGVRGMQPSVPVSAMIQTPSANTAFMASAANILMGVGLAGQRSGGTEARYDAYKGLTGGNIRRY